jgi:hypothetical protein
LDLTEFLFSKNLLSVRIIFTSYTSIDSIWYCFQDLRTRMEFHITEIWFTKRRGKKHVKNIWRGKLDFLQVDPFGGGIAIIITNYAIIYGWKRYLARKNSTDVKITGL